MEEFAFVGLTEEYRRSVLLFNKVFGANLSLDHNENFNPQKSNQYNQSDEIVALIKKNNSRDIELYNQAKKIFNSQYKALIKK